MERFEFTKNKIVRERKLKRGATVQWVAAIITCAFLGAATGYVWPGDGGLDTAFRVAIFGGILGGIAGALAVYLFEKASEL